MPEIKRRIEIAECYKLLKTLHGCRGNCEECNKKLRKRFPLEYKEFK